MDTHTYAAAGVNIEKAEAFVGRLKKQALRAGHKALWPAAGGYAAVYPVSDDTAYAVTTDGVGTKLLVAKELGKHDSIGIDLVAMCANDLICVGATPTIFLDYMAVGRLDDALADAIITGIVAGCDQAEMLLAGGETAEMPDLYGDGHYDLAGFAVGNVKRQDLLSGDKLAAGQLVIGVASSGIHSNGFSLARKVLAPGSPAYKDLLVPTSIYVKPVKEVLAKHASAISGLVHVTGGGWRNLFRINENVGFDMDNLLPLPAVMSELADSVATDEMYKTFNMGMGLAVFVDGVEAAKGIVATFAAAGHAAKVVGTVTGDAGKMTIAGCDFVLTEK